MIFEHCNYLGDLELNKKETKGIRLYNLPNGCLLYTSDAADEP